MGFLLALLFLWIPCAIFCGTIAEDKGHGGIAWFWGGLFFGPLGLLAVAALSDRKQRRYIRLMADKQGVNLGEEGSYQAPARQGISAVDAFLAQPKMPADRDD